MLAVRGLCPKTSLAHFRWRTIGSPCILPEDASDDEDPYLNPIIPILVDNTCGITNTGLEVPIPHPPQLCQVQPPRNYLVFLLRAYCSAFGVEERGGSGFRPYGLFWGLEFWIQVFSILWRVLSSHHFMIIFIKLMREALFSMLLLSLVPGTAESLLSPKVLTIASTAQMLWWTPHLTDLRGQHHVEVSPHPLFCKECTCCCWH